MSLIKQLNETANADAEIVRIAKHWADADKKANMSDKQLTDVISNDLEQLEYEPDQIDTMTTKILKLIRKQT